MTAHPANASDLLSTFRNRQARVAVIGLGYVGLPLVKAVVEAGFTGLGIDIDPEKIRMLHEGVAYLRHFDAAYFVERIGEGRLACTADFSAIERADAIVICVPTPLTKHREPDLSYVAGTARSIAPHLRKNQLVVLESTTYPGTTTELLVPELEKSGLRSGADFFVAFSPEREDPGNPDYGTQSIPKVVGGADPIALELAVALYDQIVVKTVPVSSTAAAEAVKITENIFRAVNIALVNELKLIYGAMGIDVWEVIDAAKTKPFGFMPFYPGPGLGGHCIPIDPFYLTWKAREFDMSTRLVELAGEINTAMPAHVVSVAMEALNARFAKGLKGAKVLLVGLAYKKNVGDIRESPGLTLIRLLEERGALVDYLDPHVPVITMTREHPEYAGRQSVGVDATTFERYDITLIATDHDAIDYAELVAGSRLVVDTRNACERKGVRSDKVVKA
ncbi:nucleotide sugar dehydrogenase [Mesorhizobium sp. LHD-90]|uniref:nucleotide sugar dehydrogenase n=1 Tax=Mesorhizobium sp. LHD-90 TaxID=3071414 RepID=UPI0027E070E6|nr:nucleotide sugar dehydrogenase [Mesorhizobium sp. LHD-90]MDQ6432569.1 nucleotide sugar dehydrogenase [Mesorhizobium sp. LHD-90]